MIAKQKKNAAIDPDPVFALSLSPASTPMFMPLSFSPELLPIDPRMACVLHRWQDECSRYDLPQEPLELFPNPNVSRRTYISSSSPCCWQIEMVADEK